MIEAVSSNSLIAAMFGPTAPRRSRAADCTACAEPESRVSPGQDLAEFSIAARLRAQQESAAPVSGNASPSASSPSSEPLDESAALAGQELTDEEEQQVDELKQRDQEVRRHEAAHKAAAGGHAIGGPTFEFQTGPDGKRYAVGGEVKIDTSEVRGDPEATIQKMQQVRRAALSPADPSSQDRAVATQAAAAERQARAELAKQRREEASGEAGSPEKGGSPAVASLPNVASVDPANSFGRSPTVDAGQFFDLIA